MVRVSFFILLSTLFLSACAVDQPSDTLASDIIGCMPKPTVADIWACASGKRNGATDATAEEPAADTKEASQKPAHDRFMEPETPLSE